MFEATKSLVARARKLLVPAGCISAMIIAGALVFNHNEAHAAIDQGAPLNQSAVAPLVALNHAVEAVAERVTPSVVNVAVTARVTNDQGEGGDGQEQGQSQGGVSPQDLPPGLRQFFFGFGGQGGNPQPQPQIEHGIGSGVIISSDGYIVTNDHVVNHATQIRVTLHDRRVFPAKVVGVDKLNDLAVIKIDAKNLTPIAWGDSTQVKPGETVLAFGNPFGNFPFTVTRGIVSGVDRPNPYSNDARRPGAFIQTDAAINPGNSGGPLVNAYGELIGIDTFIITNNGQFAGAGFAIPEQIVKASAEALMKNGMVHHGYLGITMNDVTPENASFFNLPDASGAIVSQVTPDSPASQAGLERGDVLRELNGKKIANGSALQVAVREMAPGTSIQLGILRNGKPMTLKATLGEFHNSGAETASNGSAKKKGKLGITIQNLTPDVRQQYNIPDNVHGAAIVNVVPGSPADNAGLAPGDVILEVNRHTVTDAQAFATQVENAPSGKDILLLVWSNGGASYRVVHPASSSDQSNQ